MRRQAMIWLPMLMAAFTMGFFLGRAQPKADLSFLDSRGLRLVVKGLDENAEKMMESRRLGILPDGILPPELEAMADAQRKK